ncbi:type II 3-dehydroquinate dehydratase [Prevotella aurantiaca]
MKIIIINGPNLNLLGKREPNIYGSLSMEEYLLKLRAMYSDIDIEYYQSNVEGELIDKLQEVGYNYNGIILNAGAYTHTSIALQDCIRAITVPVVEVHISNVKNREEYRHHSMIAPACIGTIQGFGMNSYRLAVEALKGIDKTSE